ncbi:MAG: hypothetical protein DRZ90_11120 [Spirochaetes bacterium]|nr:MAG: hypothetical protein DRZ90_11120 [Spirochaetota bacterium]
MSRKTIPILMASIAVLLIVLVVIVVFMLNSPDFRVARQFRSTALKTLLSRSPDNPEDNPLNLNLIAKDLHKPCETGGSLDNLYHFLSKDPGRRDFAGAGDRRRSAGYSGGATGIRAEQYTADMMASGAPEKLPEWVPEYVGKVRALFDNVRNDLLVITGIPESLTDLPRGDSSERSITRDTEAAVEHFAMMWLPRGETKATYSPDRQEIRDFLIGNRRFGKRMEGIDDGWKELAASMYNLLRNPRWLIAVHYCPELESELDELTRIVLAADIFRRHEDLMKLVADTDGPGIMWLPEFSYYKNIPELTGQIRSADVEDVTIFFAKVNLGYSFRDGRTQSWLNRRKDWLTDYFNVFFSEKELSDFSSVDDAEWRLALLKGGGLHEINKKIVITLPFGTKKVYGVRDLALVKVNLLTNP